MVRKIMIGMVWVAALGVAGCKDNRQEVNDERKDVAETQRKANEDIARAEHEAQTKVSEARQEAQEEVAETRKDAREDISDERQEVAEAERNLARDNNDATREELGTGGSGAAATAQVVTGQLESSLGSHLKLKLDDGKTVDLKEDDHTVVMHNSDRVELDSFETGTKVRASYITQGNDHIAREVIILNPMNKK